LFSPGGLGYNRGNLRGTIVGRRTASFYLSLLAGAAVVALSLFGFSGLLSRPEIPWTALARTTGVPGPDLPRAWDHHGLTPFGEAALRGAVVRADGFEVRDRDFDFKFVAAHHRIGDPIEFAVVVPGGRTLTVREPLVSFYAEGGMPIVFLLTGLFGFLIGFGVFVLRAEDRRARLFYWLCLAFSAAVMINGEWYGVHGRSARLVPGVLYFFAYCLTPVLLLKFVRTFAGRERLKGEPILWAAAIGFGAFFGALTPAAVLLPSVALFRLGGYLKIFRLFFFALCAASFVTVFRAFRAEPPGGRRAQLRWVLYGLTAGLGPFIVLYTLPRAAGIGPPLGEEAASAFFVLLPLALAVAILKHGFLDIKVIVKRSVVYSLLTMVTVGVYLFSVEGLKALFAAGSGPGHGWIPVGSAFIAAMVFAPARSRIQLLVDRAFFRRSYDYRRAVLGFATEAEKVHSASGLIALLDRTLDETMPPERTAAFIPAGAGAAGGGALAIGLDRETLEAVLSGPGAGEAPLAAEELGRCGFAIVLPLPLDDAGPCGWLFVGPKKSDLEFTEEDRALLRTLAAELAAALRRVRLQEEVIYERASREKLEELGRLKTEFISAVSHELRTPMTSLQSISELLKSGKVADPSRRDQLLELMAGECGRLGRYLHNVLDFGRIEQDAKRYDIRETDLGPVAAAVVEVVRSAMAGEELELELLRPDGPVVVAVDPDAVRQALFNLVDNAIKYSPGRKRVAVRLSATADGAEIAVSDNGIGIAPEDRARIFEAFYRSPAAIRQDAKGVGLGLRIVKHIMDAHGGAIAVDGGPERGTTVTLKFPKRRNS
jgi:signal transduction histidine kinase